MKTKTLLEATSKILPAVDNKGLVPEFQHLFFDGHYVEATNGSMFIRAELDEEVPTFAVEAAVFHSLLKTIQDDEIEIAVKEKAVSIKTKSIKTELGLPEKKLVSSINFDVEEWKEVPENFLRGLFLCRYTACPDQTAGPLTGVWVGDDAILSCDRWRISLYSLSVKMANMIIPVDMIDQVQRYADQVEGYAVQNGTIYFNLGKAKIGAKLLSGEYPSENLIKSLAQVDDAVKLSLSKDLKKRISEAGKRQNIIQTKALEFDRVSNVNIDNGKMTLFAQNESVGTIEETLGCEDAKDVKFEFAINPIFLTQMFTEVTNLLYSQINSVCGFEGGSFIHLVKTKSETKDE